MRAEASALAAGPNGGGGGAAGEPAVPFPGHWACSGEAAVAAPMEGAAAAAAPLQLASLGLRESWMSLLVREPAVSLSSDPRISALLPDFVEVRATLLVAAEP
jgi:hypothetical protein